MIGILIIRGHDLPCTLVVSFLSNSLISASDFPVCLIFFAAWEWVPTVRDSMGKL